MANATIPESFVYGDLKNNQSHPGGEAQLDVEYIMVTIQHIKYSTLNIELILE